MISSSTLHKCIVWIAFLCIVGCSAELTDIEHVERAKDFQDEGDLVSAIIELKSAASKNPDNPEARLILGRIYLKNGNGAAAEKELKRTVQLGVNDPQVELDLFESILMQSKFDDVITKLEMDRYTTDALRSRAFAVVGNAHVGNSKLVKAKSILEKSLGLENNAAARVGLVRASFQSNDAALALEHINSGLEDFPGDFDLNFVAADYYGRMKEYDKAISHYTKALKIRKNLYALLYRADIYVVTGDLVAAEKDLNTVLKANKKHPLANFIRAKIEYNRENYDGAREYLEHVINVLPGHVPSFLLLGASNYHIGNYQQAAVQLEKYTSRVSGNVDAERLLAEIYIRSGRSEQAIKLLTGLASGSAEDPALYALLANAYAQNREIGKAKQSLSRAHQLDPTKAFGQHLATLKMLTGESLEAAEDLESILKGESANRRAESLLIWALINSNQLERAMEFANQGVAKQPEDPLRLFMRGTVYKQSGERAAAKEDFAKALQNDQEFYLAAIALAEIELIGDNITGARQLLNQVLSINDRHVGSMYGLALMDYKEKNIPGAIAWLEKSIAVNPKGMRAVETLMGILLESGDANELLKFGRKFQNDHPENPIQFLLIGVAHSYLHNYAEAESNLQRYVDSNPGDLRTRMFLVEIASRLDSSDKLLTHLDLLLKEHPDDSYLLAIKAKSLLKDNKVDEAAVIVNKLAEQGFSNGLVTELRGDIHYTKKEYKQALAVYQELFKRVKTYNLGLKLSRLYAWFKQYDEAERILRSMLGDNPSDVALKLTIASLYSTSGKPDAADVEYREVLELDPDNIAALNNLALIYLDKGEYTDALSFAEDAYKQGPHFGAIVDTLGWVLLTMGREKEALPKLQAAAEAEDSTPEIRYHYAVALYKNSDYESAKSVLRRLPKAGAISDKVKELLEEIDQASN